jgi:hypothetical protein
MQEVDEITQGSGEESQIPVKEGYNKSHVYGNLQDFDQIRLLHLQALLGKRKN